MSALDIEKEKEEIEKEIIKDDLHKIKIFLTSKSLSAIEREARKKGVKVKGPHRLKRKRFKITTRKSPCGEGTNTYETWELRVYKRRIDIMSPANVVKDITKIGMDPQVSIDVNVEEI